ncbi:DUF4365 domain-containing protein [Streptomyces olivoreticuli]
MSLEETSMNGPRRTAAQHTGQLAEAAFAKAVTEAGLVWNPTASGSDFGIDGRVELVNSGEVSGAEFNVQIKGTACSDRIGKRVDLGKIKATTVSYWMSKLRPTLLVVHNQRNDELLYGWVHEILEPSDVFTRETKRNNSIRLRMPRKQLTEHSWGDVQAEALRAHEALQAAFAHTPTLSFYHTVYCLAADVTDLLTDIVTSIAYGSEHHLAMQFGHPDHMEVFLDRFKKEAPALPVANFHNSYLLVGIQLQALDHVLSAFLFGKFMFHADNAVP